MVCLTFASETLLKTAAGGPVVSIDARGRRNLAAIVLCQALHSLHPYKVQWVTAICRDSSSSQTIFPGAEALSHNIDAHLSWLWQPPKSLKRAATKQFVSPTLHITYRTGVSPLALPRVRSSRATGLHPAMAKTPRTATMFRIDPPVLRSTYDSSSGVGAATLRATPQSRLVRRGPRDMWTTLEDSAPVPGAPMLIRRSLRILTHSRRYMTLGSVVAQGFPAASDRVGPCTSATIRSYRQAQGCSPKGEHLTGESQNRPKSRPCWVSERGSKSRSRA